MSTTAPPIGFGIGLRSAHYPDVEEQLGRGIPAGEPLAALDWFEVISENYFGEGGNPRRLLRAVRERFPVVMHGVSLSIGSTDPLDTRHLDRLAALAREIEPALVSDHLCWGGVGGRFAHDLLPLPYTEEALAHVESRVQQVQDRLARPILLENVSSYVRFVSSAMSEWEFLTVLCQRTGCGLLLDVNNVFVSGHNHGFDPRAFILGIPPGLVGQIHLAGHRVAGALLLDTHDHPVCDEVWELYRLALRTHGPVPTLIEWDDRLPSFETVVGEARRAREIATEVASQEKERRRGLAV
jgi:uncharacterized protein (UPF0276 family)